MPTARWTRIRRVLSWTTLLTLVVGGGCLLFWAPSPVYWGGHQNVEFRFVVVDAQTRAPVERATVVVWRHGEKESSPLATLSGADGTARVILRCHTSGTAQWFHLGGA